MRHAWVTHEHTDIVIWTKFRHIVFSRQCHVSGSSSFDGGGKLSEFDKLINTNSARLGFSKWFGKPGPCCTTTFSTGVPKTQRRMIPRWIDVQTSFVWKRWVVICHLMCHLHHPENDFISKTYKIGHETPLRVQAMEHNPTTMITMVVSVMTLYLGANGQWWFKKNYQMLHAALHLTFWNKPPTKFKIGGKTQCFCAANCTLQQCQRIKQMQFLQSQKNPAKMIIKWFGTDVAHVKANPQRP